MRYALRNKSKLIKAFGEPFYLQLIESLTRHFKSNTQIERLDAEELNYQIVEVQNVNEVLQFAVTGEKYDVLTLAYYKTINK